MNDIATRIDLRPLVSRELPDDKLRQEIRTISERLPTPVVDWVDLQEAHQARTTRTMITPRIPQELHDELVAEAIYLRLSLNQLCMLKLNVVLQPNL